MKKIMLAVVKWWMIIQIVIGVGVGVASGVYLAMYFTPEEVERIMSCVAH